VDKLLIGLFSGEKTFGKSWSFFCGKKLFTLRRSLSPDFVDKKMKLVY